MRVSLFLTLFLIWWSSDFTAAKKCSSNINTRINCTPDKPGDKSACSQRQCCYSSDTNGTKAPKCFFPDDYVGYEVKQVNRETNQVVAILERRIASGFPNDVQRAEVVVTLLTDASLRIKVMDRDRARFEPPLPRLDLKGTPNAKNPLYSVDISTQGNSACLRFD